MSWMLHVGILTNMHAKNIPNVSKCTVAEYSIHRAYGCVYAHIILHDPETLEEIHTHVYIMYSISTISTSCREFSPWAELETIGESDVE